jgi:hypothetical protein
MNEKDISICKSLNSLTIIKVILKNINPNELENKFIFVGYRPDNIVSILHKLEKQQKLNNVENKQLEEAIPHYNIKFGNIEDYNIYFIYHYLEENLNINHARIIIYEAIKQKLEKNMGNNILNYQPHNLLLYKYSRNLDYKHYINLLNYIFEDEKELTNEHFFNTIYKMTYLSKKQINKKIKEILPSKYKSFDDQDEINFIIKESYNYEDCLNNEDIYHLLISIPTVLTIKYNYISEGTKYIYYGYQNIDYLLNTLRTESKDAKDYKHKDDKHKDDKIKDIKFTI